MDEEILLRFREPRPFAWARNSPGLSVEGTLAAGIVLRPEMTRLGVSLSLDKEINATPSG